MEQPHRLQLRVYYEDTDSGGIVYYANYLKFAERGRTEMLRTCGLDHVSLMRDHGAGFAVKRCAADYIKPARLDDLVVVSTRIEEMKGASLTMRQDIEREPGGETLCRLDVRLALIDGTGRPMRFPSSVATAFGR